MSVHSNFSCAYESLDYFHVTSPIKIHVILIYFSVPSAAECVLNWIITWAHICWSLISRRRRRKWNIDVNLTLLLVGTCRVLVCFVEFCDSSTAAGEVQMCEDEWLYCFLVVVDDCWSLSQVRGKADHVHCIISRVHRGKLLVFLSFNCASWFSVFCNFLFSFAAYNTELLLVNVFRSPTPLFALSSLHTEKITNNFVLMCWGFSL